MKLIEFFLFLILVTIITGSAMLEIKQYQHIECYPPEPLDDCIERQTK